MMRLYVAVCLLLAAGLSGKVIDPVSDVCWECVLPITLAGMPVTSNEQLKESPSGAVCACAGTPPVIGIPMSFWEPRRLVEVTKEPYKLHGMGGISLGEASFKNRGATMAGFRRNQKSSFAHVHVYDYPAFSILGLLEDFVCASSGSLDIAYMSEFDPSWYDESLSLILHPEAALFANPLAHVACAADCVGTSANLSSNLLFWCAGCAGSLYPFTGHVSHYVGPLQEASLLMQRALAKLHRTGLVKSAKDGDYCEEGYHAWLPKSNYKMQLAAPVAQSSGSCHALGRSDLIWGLGKGNLAAGEGFVFVLWSKRQCCIDASRHIATGAGL